MRDATNGSPLVNQGPQGTREPGADSVTRDDDGVIRLNWREKLVEAGLMMAMIMCGMLIAVIIIIASLFIMSSAFDELAPGFAEPGSISFVILIVLCAAIGNACSFVCAPYLIRLIFRGYELKDERIDRALKRLIPVTGMDIRPEKIYAIKGRTANAAMSGLFRKAQYIFFTHKLLERMNEEEISAVFAHELAHVKHKHMPRMLLAVLLWMCVVQVFLRLTALNAYFETIDEYWQMWASGGLTVVNFYLLVLLVLFPLSRRHEYQADATAARWVGIDCYKKALYRLHHLNDRLKPPRKILTKLGTHPTVQERLERIGEG